MATKKIVFFAFTLASFLIFIADGSRFKPPRRPPRGRRWRDWEGMPDAFDVEVILREWTSSEIPDWDSDSGGLSDWEDEMDDWYAEWLEFLEWLEENGSEEGSETDGDSQPAVTTDQPEPRKGLWLSTETIAIIGGMGIVVVAVIFTAVVYYCCLKRPNETQVIELKPNQTKRQKAKTRVAPSSISGGLPSAPPSYDDAITGGVNVGYRYPHPVQPLAEDPIYALLNNFSEKPKNEQKNFKKPNPNY